MALKSSLSSGTVSKEVQQILHGPACFSVLKSPSQVLILPCRTLLVFAAALGALASAASGAGGQRVAAGSCCLRSVMALQRPTKNFQLPDALLPGDALLLSSVRGSPGDAWLGLPLLGTGPGLQSWRCRLGSDWDYSMVKIGGSSPRAFSLLWRLPLSSPEQHILGPLAERERPLDPSSTCTTYMAPSSTQWGGDCCCV